MCGREGGGKQQLADCLNNDFAGSHQHSQAGIQPAVTGGLCPVFMSAAALAQRFTVVLQSQIVSSLFCLLPPSDKKVFRANGAGASSHRHRSLKSTAMRAFFLFFPSTKQFPTLSLVAFSVASNIKSSLEQSTLVHFKSGARNRFNPAEYFLIFHAIPSHSAVTLLESKHHYTDSAQSFFYTAPAM